MTQGAVLALPIETRRLRVRRPVESDMAAWMILFTDPRVISFMKEPVVRSAEEWWLRLQHQSEFKVPLLSVADRDGDQCVGQAGFIQADETVPVLEIYCRLLPDVWGRGLGTELCEALTAAAFRDLGADRVIGLIHPENAASIGMMRRLGFRPAGRIDKPKAWQNGHLVFEMRLLAD